MSNDEANPKVTKDDAEWREQLTETQYQVTRRAGTERAFTGKYWDSKVAGTYKCVCCGTELFASSHKYASGSGWPSFTQAIADGRVTTRSDVSHGMSRDEVVCDRCEAHLGHVFPDGPDPSGMRYCINSASLDLEEGSKPEPEPESEQG